MRTYLLDTHAWLWLATGSPAAAPILDQAASGEYAVSAITLWELAMLDARGRVVLQKPLSAWFGDMLGSGKYTLLPITPDIAVASGRLPEEMHGDPADRLIAATALVHRATLITADRQLLACASLAGYQTLPLERPRKDPPCNT